MNAQGTDPRPVVLECLGGPLDGWRLALPGEVDVIRAECPYSGGSYTRGEPVHVPLVDGRTVARSALLWAQDA
ncbi:hypothetical protein P8605_34660 [Streptomyces sp. T-3]|nr:hypothetical protein [Streptomyces sp. T-3]